MPATASDRPDTYLGLIRTFRLRSIRTDADLAAARRVLNRLLRRPLDKSGQEYLDALTDLIEVYEDAAHPIPDSPAADVLKVLMESNDLTQAELSDRTGIAQSTLSAVMSGTRKPTPRQMVALGRAFGVPPAAFLPRE